jgi:prepilin-type N-terminal cleavage/methylation domain-containing protein
MMTGGYYRQTRAFTLTELMVAVAIVSILAATAAVLFPQYVERAKKKRKLPWPR